MDDIPSHGRQRGGPHHRFQGKTRTGKPPGTSAGSSGQGHHSQQPHHPVAAGSLHTFARLSNCLFVATSVNCAYAWRLHSWTEICLLRMASQRDIATRKLFNDLPTLTFLRLDHFPSFHRKMTPDSGHLLFKSGRIQNIANQRINCRLTGFQPYRLKFTNPFRYCHQHYVILIPCPTRWLLFIRGSGDNCHSRPGQNGQRGAALPPPKHLARHLQAAVTVLRSSAIDGRSADW